MVSTDENSNTAGPFANHVAASYSLFHHDPLDLAQQALRLIRVLPHLTRHGRIQCRLWHSTTSSEEYKCISYMWGANTNMYVIDINGRGFAVRENLWRFLNAARHCLTGQALWVDALCINQDTVGERNHQVQQMGSIYVNARLTVVWISEVNNILRILKDNTLTVNDYLESSKLAQLRDGLGELCSNDYWRRVWVIQELLLAKELILMSEDSHLNWTTFSHFILGQHGLRNQLFITDFEECIQEQIMSSWPAKLAKMRIASSGRMHEHSLFDLLRNFGQSECSDVRDRVLGLLGLTYDFGPETFQLVDYSQDVVKLFELVRKFCISNVSVLSDTRALVQGSNLTRFQLAQVVANLPSFRVRFDNLRPMAESNNNHLACEHCQTSLVFRSFQNPTASELPIGWFKNECDANSATQRYTVTGARLSGDRIRKDIGICCLADHGFDVHLAFEETTPTSPGFLYRTYNGSPEGILLPKNNQYSDQSLSVVKESEFSLSQSIKGGVTEISGDILANYFFLLGVPSQLPVIRRFALPGDSQGQHDSIPSQKPIFFECPKPSVFLDQDHRVDDFDNVLHDFDRVWEMRDEIFSRDLRLVEDFASKAFVDCYESDGPNI